MGYLTGREQAAAEEGLFSASGTLPCSEKKDRGAVGRAAPTDTSPLALSSNTKAALE